MLESLFKKLQGRGLEHYQKETPTQVFSCKYFEIFKNTYFEKHLRTAAFVHFKIKRSIQHPPVNYL